MILTNDYGRFASYNPSVKTYGFASSPMGSPQNLFCGVYYTGEPFLSHDEKTQVYKPAFLFVGVIYSFTFFNNNEFVTTETEDKAIAVPAITGESRPNAERGIPIVL